MFWLGLLLAVSGASAQLTAQTSVAPDLRECYTNATLLNRNNLPPTTIPVLIDIIRKIEDNPNVNLDLRQLAVLLLHTYRQDGIQFHQLDTVSSANIMPYTADFHSYHRHRLLLTRIIQSTSVLGNDVIPATLKCALHHMLSITVESRVRGDENNCNSLAQYRRLRSKRKVRSISDDVEILDLSLMRKTNQNGQMRQYNPKDDVEYTNYGSTRSARQLLGDSQCPLLGGVVHSEWGALAAGSLIAGIAAGAQPQNVPVLELAKGSVLNYPDVISSVNSLYPATLSGDLAEAALIQAIERGTTNSIVVGAGGGWNSTQARRFYMLSTRTNLEMTDPEIRGDVDGFVLGSEMTSILSTNNNLKLSQLLDMFYSPRNGVYRSELRACNRRQLAQTYISSTELTSQTYAFTAALDTNMPLRGTLVNGLNNQVSSAVTSFQSYVTSTLHTTDCLTTETSSIDFRLRTNIYIVIDGAWQYLSVYPAISHLLDTIEVGKFGSSATLISAADGSIVVNKTFSLADFHSEYTAVKHQSMLTSINLETTMSNIRTLMHNELTVESQAGYVGGNSTVLLFLLQGTVQNNERVWEQARILNETVPDLRIVFATATNQFDNVWNLVRDMHDDIYTVSLTTSGTNVADSMRHIVDRIQRVGRRVINPTCGHEYTVDTLSGSRHFDDFVEPQYTNFYAISPNYFYTNNDNRKIRIVRSSSGAGSLIICYSRRNSLPRQNSTTLSTTVHEDDTICETLASNGNIEISLKDACDGYWTINTCPYFYLSVQSSVATTTTLTSVCTDNACRFPYNIRYQVQIEDFGCFSSATTTASSVLIVFLASLFVALRH